MKITQRKIRKLELENLYYHCNSINLKTFQRKLYIHTYVCVYVYKILFIEILLLINYPKEKRHRQNLTTRYQLKVTKKKKKRT